MQVFSTKQNNKITTIKIIAGKFRGKVLKARILPHTRPTKAIVKESVFNTIAPFLGGKIFVEVFAGYGSMGFEALSRGAKEIIFLEKSAESFSILQKNIALFGEESHKILAKNVDSFEILKSLLESLKNKSAILYFDPPFGENGEFYKRIFKVLEGALDSAKIAESSTKIIELQGGLPRSLALARNDDLDSAISHESQNLSQNLPQKILIFEHISSFQMPDFIAHFPLQKYKKFGKTAISYYFMA